MSTRLALNYEYRIGSEVGARIPNDLARMREKSLTSVDYSPSSYDLCEPTATVVVLDIVVVVVVVVVPFLLPLAV